jgi:hypothetical protein
VNTTKSIPAHRVAPNISKGSSLELIRSKARTETISAKSIARLSLAVLSGALLMVAGTQTASAALVNTFTWSGGTSTNATVTSTNYTVTGTGTTYTAGTTGFNYTNATIPSVYDFGNTAIYAYGLTNSGTTNDVIFTNLLGYRIDSGGLLATNTSGRVGKAAGTLYIYSTADSTLGGSATFAGNMAVYMGYLAGHSTTTRTLTQNIGSLCISNLGVNNASTVATAPTLLFAGTGTTTITGVITNKGWTGTGPATNHGYLQVGSGVMNIATTNTANTTVGSGWNSGLIISNSGSVFVGGQNSLGSQAWDVLMGSSTAGQTSTFGLFTSNEWATNAASSATITNNFVLNNAAAAVTNRFIANATTNSLTMSGNISSANANGTFQVGVGTLTLSGSNSGLQQNISILTNATLVAGSTNALGTGSVTITNGAKLQVAADLGATSKVTNQSGGAVNIAAGGRISSSALGAGALTLGGSLGNAATFNDTLVGGTQTIGALSITNYGTISMNFGSILQSSGAVTIAGAGNLLSMSGSALAGTNNLIIGSSLVLTSSDISITGGSLGTNSLSLGSSFNSGFNNYTFTNTATTLQLLVTSSAQNLYWSGAANNIWRPTHRPPTGRIMEQVPTWHSQARITHSSAIVPM